MKLRVSNGHLNIDPHITVQTLIDQWLISDDLSCISSCSFPEVQRHLLGSVQLVSDLPAKDSQGCVLPHTALLVSSPKYPFQSHSFPHVAQNAPRDMSPSSSSWRGPDEWGVCYTGHFPAALLSAYTPLDIIPHIQENIPLKSTKSSKSIQRLCRIGPSVSPRSGSFNMVNCTAFLCPWTICQREMASISYPLFTFITSFAMLLIFSSFKPDTDTQNPAPTAVV